MRLTIDQNGKAAPFIRGVLVGVVFAVLMLCALSLITAYFINKEFLSIYLDMYLLRSYLQQPSLGGL